jgi:NAD(P)H-hydrate epimerase
MLDRKKDSHKGDHGRIMVIGGSPLFYGAPILTSLAAEYSGVDLVYPVLPESQVPTIKNYSLNLIIQTFKGDYLTPDDVKGIAGMAEKMDAVVIGPGLGNESKTQNAVKKLLSLMTVPTVVDASALIFTNHLPGITVLTPHRGEFKELTGEDATPENVQKWAKQLGCTILCKGPEDIIADSDELSINKTGTTLMTVGGTGDVLSGFIGGLLAQGVEPFDAAKHAVHLLGIAGEEISGYQGSLRAIDLVYQIPQLLPEIRL